MGWPPVALGHRPFAEGVQAPVAVVGGGRLPAGELVGDERLEVLTLELADEQRAAVGLEVGGEESDGVGVGLDGAGALVLGLQGAAEAAVEDQEVTAGQLTAGGGRLRAGHGSLTRVWWSGWLVQRAPVSRVRGRRHPC